MKTETRIVRVFLARMKPAFLELSEPEKSAFMQRDRANLDALGMVAIAMVDCRDSDQAWDYMGVEGWPSLQAVEERERFEREELELAKYVEYEAHLGVEQSFEAYGKPP